METVVPLMDATCNSIVVANSPSQQFRCFRHQESLLLHRKGWYVTSKQRFVSVRPVQCLAVAFAAAGAETRRAGFNRPEFSVDSDSLSIRSRSWPAAGAATAARLKNRFFELPNASIILYRSAQGLAQSAKARQSLHTFHSNY